MNKKGFTLVEILAVIVIIGVICAIIFPKISNTINNSEFNTYKLSAQALVDCLNEYVLNKKAALISFNGCSYNFDTLTSDCTDFEYNGKSPSGGILSVDADGNVDGWISFEQYKFIVNSNKVSYSVDE